MSSSSAPTPADFLGDPLSDVTRRERRNLLAASIVAILTAHAGLIPKEVSALGIVLTASNQSAFLVLFAAVVFYFLAAFVIYGISDLLLWRQKYNDHLEKVADALENWTKEDQERFDEMRKHVPSIAWLYDTSKLVAHIRTVFEFPFPFLVGMYAIYTLLSRAWGT